MKTNQPLVSVIIPTFNRSSFLHDAIQSVLNQSYKNFEIIVVDDNSSDNTETVVNNFNNSQIRYVKNKTNLQAPGSRNVGISIAKGEIVGFLDDDDIWFNNKLSLQIPLFSNEKVGLVYGGMNLFFIEEGLSYNTQPSKEGDIITDMLIENVVGGTVSVLVRKQILEKEIFDTSFPAREEYDLWIRILKHYEARCIKQPLLRANYRNQIQRVSTNVDSYVKGIELLNKKHAHFINQKLSKKQKKRRKSEQYFFLGSQAVKVFNLSLARRYYIRSIIIKPMAKNTMAFLLSFLSVRTILYVRHLKSKISTK